MILLKLFCINDDKFIFETTKKKEKIETMAKRNLWVLLRGDVRATKK